MSTVVPAPYAESRPLPPYRALFAVDAKDFTGLPAVQHGPVSQLIPELVDQALERAELHELRDSKRFPANTGDGVVFGFDPALLPFVLWPFLGVLDDILGAYNRQCVGPRIRLRASLHVGPLPDADRPGDGNGTPRNDTHRLLDSRPVKAILAAASEQVTHLAAVISQRVYEDVVLGAYTGLHPDRCVEVPATVEGKNFSQRAWLYVPSPSGNLVQAGVQPREESAAQAGAPADPEQDPVTRPGTHYSGNTQHVGEGAAVMGSVGRDITYTGGSTSYHGTNQHWGGLLLRAHSGTGASTAAFALLADRHGTEGITGLDSPDDLSRWCPKEERGYLLQDLSPAAAASLGEVVLTALASLLRRTGAYLVVTVRADTALPSDTLPWQVLHCPPAPGEVATKRLNTMAEAGELTTEQQAEALGRLTSADFADFLEAHPLPRDGVEVAQGLRDLVAGDKSAAAVLDELNAGGLPEARRALADSGHRADHLSLMAAIALLPGQDRTVIEEFSTTLRPHLDERGRAARSTVGQPEYTAPYGRPLTEGAPAQRDVLGPAFEDRLAAVGAHPLPLRFGSQRYPVQPVGFSGRHRSEALLRCLWLDYEGMAGLLWRALDEVPHHAGIELAAGQSIGRVLAHATGPGTLRQLHPFAASDKRWRRRLVAYALGELVQHPALTGAVRNQLRQWSQAGPVTLRCTVAETCAGSYGLAWPARSLKLLDAVLDKPDASLERSLRSAVSFALSTLLSEDVNHALVLDHVREWQNADSGTQRHALAVHIMESMSLATFPRPSAPSVQRVCLADVIADHPERALGLVVAALDDPATHEATATGLSAIENDPDPRRRADFARFLATLSGTAPGHRGVLRFALRRHRARAALSAEGSTS